MKSSTMHANAMLDISPSSWSFVAVMLGLAAAHAIGIRHKPIVDNLPVDFIRLHNRP